MDLSSNSECRIVRDAVKIDDSSVFYAQVGGGSGHSEGRAGNGRVPPDIELGIYDCDARKTVSRCSSQSLREVLGGDPDVRSHACSEESSAIQVFRVSTTGSVLVATEKTLNLLHPTPSGAWLGYLFLHRLRGDGVEAGDQVLELPVREAVTLEGVLYDWTERPGAGPYFESQYGPAFQSFMEAARDRLRAQIAGVLRGGSKKAQSVATVAFAGSYLSLCSLVHALLYPPIASQDSGTVEIAHVVAEQLKRYHYEDVSRGPVVRESVGLSEIFGESARDRLESSCHRGGSASLSAGGGVSRQLDPSRRGSRISVQGRAPPVSAERLLEFGFSALDSASRWRCSDVAHEGADDASRSDLSGKVRGGNFAPSASASAARCGVDSLGVGYAKLGDAVHRRGDTQRPSSDSVRGPFDPESRRVNLEYERLQSFAEWPMGVSQANLWTPLSEFELAPASPPSWEAFRSANADQSPVAADTRANEGPERSARGDAATRTPSSTGVEILDVPIDPTLTNPYARPYFMSRAGFYFEPRIRVRTDSNGRHYLDDRLDSCRHYPSSIELFQWGRRAHPRAEVESSSSPRSQDPADENCDVPLAYTLASFSPIVLGSANVRHVSVADHEPLASVVLDDGKVLICDLGVNVRPILLADPWLGERLELNQALEESANGALVRSARRSPTRANDKIEHSLANKEANSTQDRSSSSGQKHIFSLDGHAEFDAPPLVASLLLPRAEPRAARSKDDAPPTADSPAGPSSAAKTRAPGLSLADPEASPPDAKGWYYLGAAVSVRRGKYRDIQGVVQQVLPDHQLLIRVKGLNMTIQVAAEFVEVESLQAHLRVKCSRNGCCSYGKLIGIQPLPAPDDPPTSPLNLHEARGGSTLDDELRYAGPQGDRQAQGASSSPSSAKIRNLSGGRKNQMAVVLMDHPCRSIQLLPVSDVECAPSAPADPNRFGLSGFHDDACLASVFSSPSRTKIRIFQIATTSERSLRLLQEWTVSDLGRLVRALFVRATSQVVFVFQRVADSICSACTVAVWNWNCVQCFATEKQTFSLFSDGGGARLGPGEAVVSAEVFQTAPSGEDVPGFDSCLALLSESGRLCLYTSDSEGSWRFWKAVKTGRFLNSGRSRAKICPSSAASRSIQILYSDSVETVELFEREDASCRRDPQVDGDALCPDPPLTLEQLRRFDEFSLRHLRFRSYPPPLVRQDFDCGGSAVAWTFPVTALLELCRGGRPSRDGSAPARSPSPTLGELGEERRCDGVELPGRWGWFVSPASAEGAGPSCRFEFEIEMAERTKIDSLDMEIEVDRPTLDTGEKVDGLIPKYWLSVRRHLTEPEGRVSRDAGAKGCEASWTAAIDCFDLTGMMLTCSDADADRLATRAFSLCLAGVEAKRLLLCLHVEFPKGAPDDANKDPGWSGGLRSRRGGPGAVDARSASRSCHSFDYASDFDRNGVMYWIGSKGGRTSWKNPAGTGLVSVQLSHEALFSPDMRKEDVIDRGGGRPVCWGGSSPQWLVVDLGVCLRLRCTAYTLRHGGHRSGGFLQNWTFSASRDGKSWEALHEGAGPAFSERCEARTWSVQSGEYHRYFRVMQRGAEGGAQRAPCYVSVSGFELYGSLLVERGCRDPRLPSLIRVMRMKVGKLVGASAESERQARARYRAIFGSEDLHRKLLLTCSGRIPASTRRLCLDMIAAVWRRRVSETVALMVSTGMREFLVNNVIRADRASAVRAANLLLSSVYACNLKSSDHEWTKGVGPYDWSDGAELSVFPGGRVVCGEVVPDSSDASGGGAQADFCAGLWRSLLDLVPALAEEASHPKGLERFICLLESCWSVCPDASRSEVTETIRSLSRKLYDSRKPLYRVLHTCFGLDGFPLQLEAFEIDFEQLPPRDVDGSVQGGAERGRSAVRATPLHRLSGRPDVGSAWRSGDADSSAFGPPGRDPRAPEHPSSEPEARARRQLLRASSDFCASRAALTELLEKRVAVGPSFDGRRVREAHGRCIEARRRYLGLSEALEESPVLTHRPAEKARQSGEFGLSRWTTVTEQLLMLVNRMDAVGLAAPEDAGSESSPRIESPAERDWWTEMFIHCVAFGSCLLRREARRYMERRFNEETPALLSSAFERLFFEGLGSAELVDLYPRRPVFDVIEGLVAQASGGQRRSCVRSLSALLEKGVSSCKARDGRARDAGRLAFCEWLPWLLQLICSAATPRQDGWGEEPAAFGRSSSVGDENGRSEGGSPGASGECLERAAGGGSFARDAELRAVFAALVCASDGRYADPELLVLAVRALSGLLAQCGPEDALREIFRQPELENFLRNVTDHPWPPARGYALRLMSDAARCSAGGSIRECLRRAIKSALRRRVSSRRAPENFSSEFLLELLLVAAPREPRCVDGAESAARGDSGRDGGGASFLQSVADDLAWLVGNTVDATSRTWCMGFRVLKSVSLSRTGRASFRGLVRRVLLSESSKQAVVVEDFVGLVEAQLESSGFAFLREARLLDTALRSVAEVCRRGDGLVFFRLLECVRGVDCEQAQPSEEELDALLNAIAKLLREAPASRESSEFLTRLVDWTAAASSSRFFDLEKCRRCVERLSGSAALDEVFRRLGSLESGPLADASEEGARDGLVCALVGLGAAFARLVDSLSRDGWMKRRFLRAGLAALRVSASSVFLARLCSSLVREEEAAVYAATELNAFDVLLEQLRVGCGWQRRLRSQFEPEASGWRCLRAAEDVRARARAAAGPRGGPGGDSRSAAALAEEGGHSDRTFDYERAPDCYASLYRGAACPQQAPERASWRLDGGEAVENLSEFVDLWPSPSDAALEGLLKGGRGRDRANWMHQFGEDGSCRIDLVVRGEDVVVRRICISCVEVDESVGLPSLIGVETGMEFTGLVAAGHLRECKRESRLVDYCARQVTTFAFSFAEELSFRCVRVRIERPETCEAVLLSEMRLLGRSSVLDCGPWRFLSGRRLQLEILLEAVERLVLWSPAGPRGARGAMDVLLEAASLTAAAAAENSLLGLAELDASLGDALLESVFRRRDERHAGVLRGLCAAPRARRRLARLCAFVAEEARRRSTEVLASSCYLAPFAEVASHAMDSSARSGDAYGLSGEDVWQLFDAARGLPRGSRVRRGLLRLASATVRARVEHYAALVERVTRSVLDEFGGRRAVRFLQEDGWFWRTVEALGELALSSSCAARCLLSSGAFECVVCFLEGALTRRRAGSAGGGRAARSGLGEKCFAEGESLAGGPRAGAGAPSGVEWAARLKILESTLYFFEIVTQEHVVKSWVGGRLLGPLFEFALGADATPQQVRSVRNVLVNCANLHPRNRGELASRCCEYTERGVLRGERWSRRGGERGAGGAGTREEILSEFGVLTQIWIDLLFSRDCVTLSLRALEGAVDAEALFERLGERGEGLVRLSEACADGGLSVGRRTVTARAVPSAGWRTARATKPVLRGARRWEVVIERAANAENVVIGVCEESQPTNACVGRGSWGWGYDGAGRMRRGGRAGAQRGEKMAQGDVIGVSVDMDRGTLSFSRNGRDLGVAFEDLKGKRVYPAVSLYSADDRVRFRRADGAGGGALLKATKNSAFACRGGLQFCLPKDTTLREISAELARSGIGASEYYVRANSEQVDVGRRSDQLPLGPGEPHDKRKEAALVPIVDDSDTLESIVRRLDLGNTLDLYFKFVPSDDVSERTGGAGPRSGSAADGREGPREGGESTSGKFVGSRTSDFDSIRRSVLDWHSVYSATRAESFAAEASKRGGIRLLVRMLELALTMSRTAAESDSLGDPRPEHRNSRPCGPEALRAGLSSQSARADSARQQGPKPWAAESGEAKEGLSSLPASKLLENAGIVFNDRSSMPLEEAYRAHGSDGRGELSRRKYTSAPWSRDAPRLEPPPRGGGTSERRPLCDETLSEETWASWIELLKRGLEVSNFVYLFFCDRECRALLFALMAHVLRRAEALSGRVECSGAAGREWPAAGRARSLENPRRPLYRVFFRLLRSSQSDPFDGLRVRNEAGRAGVLAFMLAEVSEMVGGSSGRVDGEFDAKYAQAKNLVQHRGARSRSGAAGGKPERKGYESGNEGEAPADAWKTAENEWTGAEEKRRAVDELVVYLKGVAIYLDVWVKTPETWARWRRNRAHMRWLVSACDAALSKSRRSRILSELIGVENQGREMGRRVPDFLLDGELPSPSGAPNASDDTLQPELDPCVYRLIAGSGMAAFVCEHLRNDSLLDVDGQFEMYRCVFRLGRAFFAHPALILECERLGTSFELESILRSLEKMCGLLRDVAKMREKWRSRVALADEDDITCEIVRVHRMVAGYLGCKRRRQDALKSWRNSLRLARSRGSADGGRSLAGRLGAVEAEEAGLGSEKREKKEKSKNISEKIQETSELNDLMSNKSGAASAAKSVMSDSAAESKVVPLRWIGTSTFRGNNVEEQYVNIMKPHLLEEARFKTHSYKANNANAQTSKRLIQEISILCRDLPVHFDSSIFVRTDTDNICLMKCMIIGPRSSPYSGGCFFFDIWFPPDYPNSPPRVRFMTTGDRSFRFNPNLYPDGKVCLSILNTWHGTNLETWDKNRSTLLQVLVSIQSLVLTPNPYFNEPGSGDNPAAQLESTLYNKRVRIKTIQWAMIDVLENPPEPFKSVIMLHFWLSRHQLMKTIDEWIVEDPSNRPQLACAKTKLQNLISLLYSQSI